MNAYEKQRGSQYVWWIGQSPNIYEVGCDAHGVTGIIIKHEDVALLNLDDSKGNEICYHKIVSRWSHINPTRCLEILSENIRVSLTPKAGQFSLFDCA